MLPYPNPSLFQDLKVLNLRHVHAGPVIRRLARRGLTKEPSSRRTLSPRPGSSSADSVDPHCDHRIKPSHLV